MPNRSPEQLAFVHLLRTQNEKLAELSALIKAHGLSEPQYNVLRILRGAGEEGLASGRISERMLTRLPDITRLVDRLERAGLVTRERVEGDRRVVVVRITPEGLTLLHELDGPIGELHKRQFSALTRTELAELIRLLRKSRGTP